jgi:autotransporter-associated beta strand protein
MTGTGSGGVTYTSEDVWSDGTYNAFTDLTSYDGNLYLVFAASSGQSIPAVGQPGKIRVLESANGQNWTPVALLSSSGDLRDPKISVTPSNQLMIISGDVSQTAPYVIQSAAWFSSDGTNWGNENPTGVPDYWIWRTVWHNGVGYGISYGPNNTDPTNGWEQATFLSTTTDGLNYTAPALQLSPSGEKADESGLTFLPNGTAVMVTRCDLGELSYSASVGVATGNYTNWTFTSANMRIESPDLLTLPDGRIVCAARMYTGNTSGHAYTSLSWVDPTTGIVTPFLAFPYCTNGSSDTGYPGLCWYNNQLWVSYYSFTNNLRGADIFVAQVSIPSSGPTSFWTVGSGSWSTTGNWTNEAPNKVGAVAVIDAPTTSPVTITLDSPNTIGSLVLGSGTPGVGYTLSGSGTNTLTLSNSGSGATITVSDGAHVLDAPVVLADNLVVTGSGTLEFSSSSSITETNGSHSLTMNGAGGRLILSGSDTYTGGTMVTGGTLILASNTAIADGTSLTVDGSVLIFNPLTAGASPVTLLQDTQGASPVPEPGTLALLIAGLTLGLCAWWRRAVSRSPSGPGGPWRTAHPMGHRRFASRQRQGIAPRPEM